MIAAKHSLMRQKQKPNGCHVSLSFNSETGLYISFSFRNYGGRFSGESFTIDWGDGSALETRTWSGTADIGGVSHTYPAYGDYTMIIAGKLSSGFGIRVSDSSIHYSYETAITSIIDYSNIVLGTESGCFGFCTNLKTVVLPAVLSCGQSDFSGCTSLETVAFGAPAIYYDSVFRNCTKLKDFTTNYDTMLPVWEELNVNLATRAAQCWHYVWYNCSSLTELHLGHIRQFGKNDFSGCTKLTDIYVSNHTVSEIKANFGTSAATFPFGAGSSVKFHGTDGYVLGNGTIVT